MAMVWPGSAVKLTFFSTGCAVFVFGGDVVELHLALDGGMSLAPGLVLDGGLLVQQAEDAFRAGDRALDVGPQHGDLLDGLVEALHVGQEGDHQAQRDGRAKERAVAEQSQAAHAGDDRQGQVAQRFQRRRQRGGEGHRAHVGIAVVARWSPGSSRCFPPRG